MLSGGKGASSVRLVEDGLPVPPGCHATTTAYDRNVAEEALAAQILATDATASEEKPGSCNEAADVIARLIAG